MSNISSESPFIIAISDFIPIIDEESNNYEYQLSDLNNYLEIETFKEIFDSNLNELIDQYNLVDQILNNAYQSNINTKKLFDDRKKIFADEFNFNSSIIEYLKDLNLKKTYIEFLYNNFFDLNSNSLKITVPEMEEIIVKYNNVFFGNTTTVESLADKIQKFNNNILLKYAEIDIDGLFFDTEIGLNFNNIQEEENLFNNIKSVLIAKLFDEFKKNLYSHQSNITGLKLNNQFPINDRISFSSIQNLAFETILFSFFTQNFTNANDFNFSSVNAGISNTIKILQTKYLETNTNTIEKKLYSLIKIFIKELNFSSLRKNVVKIDNILEINPQMLDKVFGKFNNNFFDSEFNESKYLNNLLYFKKGDDIILNLEYNFFEGNFSQINSSRKFISGKDEYLDSIEFLSLSVPGQLPDIEQTTTNEANNTINDTITIPPIQNQIPTKNNGTNSTIGNLINNIGLGEFGNVLGSLNNNVSFNSSIANVINNINNIISAGGFNTFENNVSQESQQNNIIGNNSTTNNIIGNNMIGNNIASNNMTPNSGLGITSNNLVGF